MTEDSYDWISVWFLVMQLAGRRRVRQRDIVTLGVAVGAAADSVDVVSRFQLKFKCALLFRRER